VIKVRHRPWRAGRAANFAGTAPVPRRLGAVAMRPARPEEPMIRKLTSGEYRLYSRKTDPRTGKRRNLGTFRTRAEAERHERAVQYFKHH
jgi:hypothetical protein